MNTLATKKTAQQREAEVLRKLQGEGAKYRTAEVVKVDIEARTVELAFSSEAEVPRWYGIEILSHDRDAVDLSRLNDGGAVMVGHDWSDHRGVVENAWIADDRKGRAIVRLSRSARGEELLQDIADGIVRHVSVGYFVKTIKLTEEREDVDVYTITRWQPYEISFVPVPADVTVGIGRSADIPAMGSPQAEPETSIVPPTRDASDNKETPTNMKEKITRDASGNLVRAKVNDDGNIVEIIEVLERAGDDLTTATQRGSSTERARVRAISDAAGNFANVEGIDALARTALSEGHSVEQFQSALLEKLEQRSTQPLADQARGADIGLSEREIGQFSVLKVVRALIDPSDKKAQKEAGFEFEAPRAAADKSGKAVEHFMIPTDVLRNSVYGGSRALNTGVGGSAADGSTGGNLVARTLMASSFIDILRNKATIMSRGHVIGGLVGNIDIPKQLAAAQGYWLGEDEDTTETGIELGQIPLSPKTVGAFTEYTRRMAMQSSLDAEALLRYDLASALALTIDKAGYYGSGSDHQPRGIANYTGINAVPFAGVFPTYAELVDMETAIATDNADVNGMVYVSNAGFRGNAKTTLKFQNVAGTIWEQGNTVNGYTADITNQVAKGDVFFGNFADLLIAMWGGLELQVDPYSNSKKGRVRIVVFQDVDFALRRVESFALGRKAVK